MKKLIKNYKGIYVRPNDFDEKDDLRPSAILDYFQFMATDHAEDINLGYLEKKKSQKKLKKLLTSNWKPAIIKSSKDKTF